MKDGGFYYYNPPANRSYQQVILEVAEEARTLKLPYACESAGPQAHGSLRSLGRYAPLVSCRLSQAAPAFEALTCERLAGRQLVVQARGTAEGCAEGWGGGVGGAAFGLPSGSRARVRAHRVERAGPRTVRFAVPTRRVPTRVDAAASRPSPTFSHLLTPAFTFGSYWSSETVYATARGGGFPFLLGERESAGFALPASEGFWHSLFKRGRKWGLAVFEQDWLNIQSEWRGLKSLLLPTLLLPLTERCPRHIVTLACAADRFAPLTRNATLGRTWFRQMGRAAEAQRVSIQLCAQPPRPKHIRAAAAPLRSFPLDSAAAPLLSLLSLLTRARRHGVLSARAPVHRVARLHAGALLRPTSPLASSSCPSLTP